MKLSKRCKLVLTANGIEQVQKERVSDFLPYTYRLYIYGGINMILSDKTITRMLGEKSLIINPLTEEQIQPASVDIRLGNTFSVVDDTPSGIITLDSQIKYKSITADTYLILPGQFVLAATMEYFELPNNMNLMPTDVQ